VLGKAALCQFAAKAGLGGDIHVRLPVALTPEFVSVVERGGWGGEIRVLFVDFATIVEEPLDLVAFVAPLFARFFDFFGGV
jgi:hypothetical protein